MSPRASFATVFALGVIGSGACLEAREGGVGGVKDSDGGEADGDATATDTRVDATADVPAEVDTGLDACAPTSSSLTSVSTVQMNELERGSPRFVTPNLLVGSHHEDDASGARRTRIVAVDIASRARKPLFEARGDTTLADARGGALIGFQQRDDGRSFDLFYAEVDVRGVAVVASPPRTLVTVDNSAGTSLTPGLWDFGGEVHAVERGLAAWAEHVSAVPPVHRVRLYRPGADVRTVVEGPSWVGAPYVGSGRLLWSVQTAPQTLWFHDTARDHTQRLASATTFEGYVLTAEAPWWLTEGKLYRGDFDGGDGRLIDEGPCAGLAAGAGGVVSVCGPDAKASWLFASGTPVYFDGARRVSLGTLAADTSNRSIASVTVLGDRVAWLEYPLDAGCDGGFDTRGDLVLATIGGARPVRLAEVGVGCWCCNAIWPPPHLDLSPVGLTWNYPVETSAYPVVEVGVGLFDTTCAP